MKKFILFLIVSQVYFNIYSSNVSGNAFLDNDTNHSNIKITFSPISPSATFKEIFSNMDGSYDTEVDNGVYSITYTKEGFLDHIITEVLLNGVISLDDITLSSKTLIEVSGNVEGNWTNNNEYRVIGDINIGSNKSLNIEQGTEIKFDGYFTFTIDGALVANGSENQPILFTSNNGITPLDYWNQIIINSNTSTSILNHCIIENGKRSDDDFAGVIEINGNAMLSNSIFRNTQETGIKINTTGTVSLVNNKIYNCRAGILTDVQGNGNITIDNNMIYDISLIGIGAKRSEESITDIINNEVYDCGLYGIQVTGKANIIKNLIYEINNSPGSCGIFVNGNQPTIRNNTIVLCTSGIRLYEGLSFNANPIINSNIIAYSTTGYAIFPQGLPKPAEVKYNLFFNNPDGIGNNLPLGVGTIITTNNNGTPSDTYSNIFLNPQLSSISPLDDNFCELNSDSPTIDAGDPNFKDPDDSIIDIGAKRLESRLSISSTENVSSEKNNLRVYPNPISNILKFESKTGFNGVEIYNSLGKIVHFASFTSKQLMYEWNQSSILPAGFYLYQIKDGYGIIKSGKIMKK